MVYLFLADGCEEIEALAQVDILRRAGIDIKTVGVTGEEITGAHNIKIKADISPEEVERELIDAVILPGGLKGTQNLDESDFVKDTVNFAFEKGKLVCAICAAPMILGKMGILSGKKATCYPGFEEYFKNAQYEKTPVIKDGNVITAQAMGSAYDFALEIVSCLLNSETSAKVKEEIYY